MPYIGNTIRAADDYRLIDDISSSFNGSTTSFALQVAGSAPVPFPKSPQQVLISVNGVIQEPDPTGASGFNLVGTNIVFSSAPTNGHAFFGIIYATADYLNAGGNFPSGSLGAPSFTFIGDENTGLYRKSGGSVGFVSDATEIANFDSNGITISSGNLILGDSAGASSDRVVLGASSDLSIYHNGTNSIIDNNTNDLIIRSDGDDLKLLAEDDIVLRDNDDSTNFIHCINGGAVELFHNGNKKAETVSGGFTVTGTLTATTLAGTLSTAAQTNVTSLGTLTGLTLSGDMTFTGDSANIVFDKSTDDLIFNDGAKAIFGTSSDGIEIYHASDESFIDDQGTGNLFIRSNGAGIHLKKHGTTETLAKFNTDGNNEFYFDNSKKAETVTGGFTVTGTCTATTFSGSGASLTSLPSGQLTGALPAIDGSNLTGISGITINGNANNRILTATGNSNEIDAEGALTFTGDILSISSTTQGLGARFTNTGNEYTNIQFSANRTSARNALGIINAKWNNNDEVAAIYLQTGDDTTNKDDGIITFFTKPSGGNLASRMVIETDGNVKVTDGDLVIGTSGHGIDFSATGGPDAGSGSSTSEVLDDYERGTFVANIVQGLGSLDQTFDDSATYEKVGNLVHIQALIQFRGTGNGTQVYLRLPYTHVTDTSLGGGLISYTNVAGLENQSTLSLVGQSGQSYCAIRNKSSNPSISGFQNNQAIYYHFTYHTS